MTGHVGVVPINSIVQWTMSINVAEGPFFVLYSSSNDLNLKMVSAASPLLTLCITVLDSMDGEMVVVTQ